MSTFRVIVLMFVLLLGFFGTTGAIADEANVYRVQLGDVLSVIVYGEPDLSYEVPVLADGTISYPFLGHDYVVGLSLTDIENRISEQLTSVIRMPIVSVSVRPEKRPSVIVLGEVASPGVYPMVGGEIDLLELVALAGGPTTVADLDRVKVYDRANIRRFDEAPIGKGSLLFEGEALNNPSLVGGNIVYVPPAAEAYGEVFIIGEVRSPGAYPTLPGREVRLLDVVARAGGPTPTADLSGVTVYESGDVSDFRSAPIGASGILFEGEQIENIELRPGNIVYVPPGPQLIEVMVMGPVARPGSYEVPSGTNVLRLLGVVGGLLPDADSSSLTLRRETALGTIDMLPVNVDRMLSGDTNEHNYKLEQGDVVVVQPMIQVAVAGEVRQNGSFPLRSKARITDAILKAGGMTDRADAGRVLITRSIDGEQALLHVDFDAILTGEGDNVLLVDGDIINVSRSDRLVFVTGEVNRPGSYSVTDETRLVELIFTAGGPTQASDAEEITIYDDGEVTFKGPLVNNPRIAPGQTVHVPSSLMGISVVGTAASTGMIDVPRRSRILDVVAHIGGLGGGSNWDRVQVLRQTGDVGEMHVVDVLALLNDPDPDKNIVMEDGDVVYIPTGGTTVSILGEVPRPGVYTMSPDSRLVDVLAAAGGAESRAALEKVNVMAAGESLYPREVPLGKYDRLRPDEIDENVKLEDGDVIVVPKSDRITWQDIVAFLTGVKLIKDLLQ